MELMAKQPIYDPDALRVDIKREDENIRVFNEEVEKARTRKVELEFYLKQALEHNKNK